MYQMLYDSPNFERLQKYTGELTYIMMNLEAMPNKYKTQFFNTLGDY